MVRRASFESARSRDRLLTWGALSAAVWLAACAVGVDISDAERAEICASPSNFCPDEPPASSASGAGGTPGGFSGTSGTGGTLPSAGSGGLAGTGSGAGGTPSAGSGNASGSSGAAGSGGSPLQPLAMGQCLPTDDVVIIYTDRGDNTNAGIGLSVQNDGAAFNLTDLAIRYWFTGDGLSDFTADIDYATQSGGNNISSAVSVQFGEEFGSDYASIEFTSGGSVGPEGVEKVELRIHTGNYQPLNQANDFSFLDNASGVPNRNITPYVNGVQVGGCVPLPP